MIESIASAAQSDVVGAIGPAAARYPLVRIEALYAAGRRPARPARSSQNFSEATELQ